MDDKSKSKKEKTKEILNRAMWGFMALLFIVTGVGIGIYYFWQATHPPKDNTNMQQSNQLKGTKLNGFTPVAKVDTLQKIDQKAGNGAEVKSNSTLIVHYTGALAATGIIFESSLDSGQPATFPLNQVIKGWQEGLVGMKVGGQRRLLIPATQAYGATERPGIPANSDLVFDVTLLSVK